MKAVNRICYFLIFIIFLSCSQFKNEELKKQNNPVANTYLNKVEPPHWWTGFKEQSLQLMVYDENIGLASPALIYKGVHIEKVHKANSPNYLFIDLVIDSTTKPGEFDIEFTFDNQEVKKHTYTLKTRYKSSKEYVGFDSSDAIYLITPDRFSNGDSSNDIDESLLEKTVNRRLDYARHGGDIKGIINHLDYIEDMGFTAIWSTPLLINDMPQWSYHGYAMTDYYKVDPRFGTLEEYVSLANKAREKGIKIIMDQVANHCGLNHWWMNDLPFSDWVNNQDLFKSKSPTSYSNHRRTINQDTYASEIDKTAMSDGWFVDAMPDLNQRNPFLAKYIIQNSLWWIETLGLGGIRQDTYPYPDKTFMANWAGAIMNEYPNFNIVGEEWSYNPLLVGYWQRGAKNKDGYESNLRSTMDFPLQEAVVKGLSEPEAWNSGLIKMYEALANDFYYASPNDLMVFPDNHDMDRIFTQFEKSLINTKMALGYLLMLPRIPQIYYGTEILLDNSTKKGDHGLIRTDFPGGWQDDTINAFSGNGLSDSQKEMQYFLKEILNYRKKSSAIHMGKTIHFTPENGIYVLLRIHEDETVVLILNKNNKEINLPLFRFKETGLEEKTLLNLLTKEKISWKDSLFLKAKGATILSTKI